ncbi:CBS domain-containing protein [Streptomyces sp. NPDC001604]|uniref:CBS domain-containing protein n=1 Tax=Streptomyces sp. NPDC001604 TaxID=3364593 RepID=UPI0036BA9271
MTPIQTHRNPSTSEVMARVDHVDAIELRVFDDMTVEVALSVMAGAGVDHLLLCDGDDERTGSVTRAQLAVHRDSSAYTDHVRLRDVLDAPCQVIRPSSFSL